MNSVTQNRIHISWWLCNLK